MLLLLERRSRSPYLQTSINAFANPLNCNEYGERLGEISAGYLRDGESHCECILSTDLELPLGVAKSDFYSHQSM